MYLDRRLVRMTVVI